MTALGKWLVSDRTHSAVLMGSLAMLFGLLEWMILGTIFFVTIWLGHGLYWVFIIGLWAVCVWWSYKRLWYKDNGLDEKPVNDLE